MGQLSLIAYLRSPSNNISVRIFRNFLHKFVIFLVLQGILIYIRFIHQ